MILRGGIRKRTMEQEELSARAPAPTEGSSTESELPRPSADSPSETPPLDWDSLAAHPEYARRNQAEIDRRAHREADARFQQSMAEYKRTQLEATQKEAREQAEQARIELVTRASQGDIEAQERLAQEESTRLQYARWEREHTERLRASASESVGRGLQDYLHKQYEEGYGRIPEAADRAFLSSVHHRNFQSAADWLVAYRDALYAKWRTSELETEAKRRADTLVSEQMAAYRARLPNPELFPPIGGGNGRSFNSLADAEAAHVRGEISNAEMRRYIQELKGS